MNFDKICNRCKGHIYYKIQEEDGFQYIVSECPCATERHVAVDFDFERNLEAEQFITVEEMTL